MRKKRYFRRCTRWYSFK